MAELTLINGSDVVRDPGLARLRRTLPILAVIGAPFAGLGGHYDPVTTLDPVEEWQMLVGTARTAGQIQRGACAPLALVRLLPPTSARLGEALAAGDADGFRAVHIVCYGERDTLYLEDASGAEDYVVAEHLVRLFQTSRAALVVLEGCFSRRLAQMIVEETPVVAVLGTQRRVPPANASAFYARFYAEISGGTDIREAFRMAISALGPFAESGANRYELVSRDAVRDLTVPLPPAAIRATRCLIADGQPRQIGVPALPGFIGRRVELTALTETVAATVQRPVVLHGVAGVGKTRLAAIYAQRMGWNFPDGVLWQRCTAVTTAQDLRGRLARLLGRAPNAPITALVTDLQTRRALIVLDQFDTIEDAGARAETLALLDAVLAHGECRVLLTARSARGLADDTHPGQALALDRFDPKTARTLALRLAVERGLDTLDVDTIDDFLERTLNLPWLILKGLDWIATLGITGALDALAGFGSGESDVLAFYFRQQVQALGVAGDEALRLLRRAANLPDAFDERLAQYLARERATEQINTLLHYGLLERDGDRLRMPAGVRTVVNTAPPQSPADLARQGQLDRAIMEYLTRTWPEPNGSAGEPFPTAITARLNNARALLAFHLARSTGMDPGVLARLLIAAAPAFRAVGLGAEFSRYARVVRDRLPEGPDLARLQIVMGELLADDPEALKEAGWLLQVTLQIGGLEPSLAARARLVYARFLLTNAQPEPALNLLTEAFKLLRTSSQPELALGVELMHLRGQVLMALGRDADAIKMLQEALAGYARLERTGAAAAALRELAGLLLRHALSHTESADRAQDLLRRALVSADHIGDHTLAAQIRGELAAQIVAGMRAEEPAADRSALDSAAALWSDVLWDRLAAPEPAALAVALSELALVEARAGALEDASAAAGRSAALCARLGNRAGYMGALVLVGQFRIAAGDAVAAQAALHTALELGAVPGADEVQRRAAGLLVRVHQIRARRAPRATEDYVHDSQQSALQSRTLLDQLGLADHVAALDQVLASLGH